MAALRKTKSPFPGVISVLLSGLVPLGLVILLGALYVANKVTYDHDVKNGLAALISLYFFVLAPILHALGLLIGIIGLFPRNSSKLLSLFGAIANFALPIIGVFIFLLGIGLAASSGVR